jgi:putative DNA primase/helicase
VITGTDEGIWRRIRLVPWDVEIPAAEQDEELGSKLVAEATAVLAWLMAGYQDWHEHGLDDPEQATMATNAYRAEFDALARFIDQQCLTGPHFNVGSAELFRAWSAWCSAEGEDADTQKAFSTALTNRGFDKFKDGAGRMRWRGLGLTASDGE